jgi:hypothetical protein
MDAIVIDGIVIATIAVGVISTTAVWVNGRRFPSRTSKR